MSVLFGSSVSRYNTAAAAQEWTSFGDGSIVTIVPAVSRWGGSVVRCTNTDTTSGGVFTKGVPASGAMGILHFAWKPSNLALWSNNVTLIAARSLGTAQVSLKPTPGGGIECRRGLAQGGTSLGVSAAGLLADGVWAQLQFKYVIHASSGVIEVRLNGDPTPILTLTGQNTLGAAGAVWDEVLFTRGTGVNNAHTQDFCDFLFLDGVDATATQGAPYNDFQGDVSIRPHFPRAAGASAAWTRYGTDSGANWSQLDETVATGDTDGVSTPTDGARDTYAMEALKATGQAIVAVIPVAQVKKLDAGAAKVGPAFRQGATNYDPTVGVSPSTAYSFMQMLNGPWLGKAPDSTAWNETKFNAIESGPYKVP